MFDPNEVVDRLQRAVGAAYKRDKDFLNTPGRSPACKIDPHYYLAVQPNFINKLTRLTGFRPEKITSALITTANMIVNPAREHVLKAGLVWRTDKTKTMRLAISFLLAGFVDRAVMMYAGARDPLPVSDLRIHKADKSLVDNFFTGKTALHDAVFA